MTVRRWITQGVLEAMTLPPRGTRQSYRLCRASLEAFLSPGHMPNGGPTTGLTDVGAAFCTSKVISLRGREKAQQRDLACRLLHSSEPSGAVRSRWTECAIREEHDDAHGSRSVSD